MYGQVSPPSAMVFIMNNHGSQSLGSLRTTVFVVDDDAMTFQGYVSTHWLCSISLTNRGSKVQGICQVTVRQHMVESIRLQVLRFSTPGS